MEINAGFNWMIGAHSAENIKLGIEKIVNRYSFNKKKISSIVCDEGSSLVRLFKQNSNAAPLYVDIDENTVNKTDTKSSKLNDYNESSFENKNEMKFGAKDNLNTETVITTEIDSKSSKYF